MVRVHVRGDKCVRELAGSNWRSVEKPVLLGIDAQMQLARCGASNRLVLLSYTLDILLRGRDFHPHLCRDLDEFEPRRIQLKRAQFLA